MLEGKGPGNSLSDYFRIVSKASDEMVAKNVKSLEDVAIFDVETLLLTKPAALEAVLMPGFFTVHNRQMERTATAPPGTHIVLCELDVLAHQQLF